MKPERVDKRLNRMLALNRQSVIKPTKSLDDGKIYESGQTFNSNTSTVVRPEPPQYEQVTRQSEQYEPLDLRVDQPVILAVIERPTSRFPQPILSSRDKKNSQECRIKGQEPYYCDICDFIGTAHGVSVHKGKQHKKSRIPFLHPPHPPPP